MPRSVDRRTFLRGAVAASSLGWMPAVSRARVPGAARRLALGVIGTGGMGTSHLHGLVGRRDADDVEVIRVCDVYRRRLDAAVGLIGGGADAGTMEYREVIDDPDVDAVLIATPDHWHVKIAIEAMEAGKDVYCEKPLSHTIPQAIDCRDAVRRTGRVLQVGPQGTSEGRWWAARDAIARNRIGKPAWSQGAYCRNSRGGQFNWRIDPDAGPTAPRDAPGYVWWDRWLGAEWGLAESIPWDADRFFRFRKYFAYNGGVATDLLYHKLAPLLLALTGPTGEYPRRVVAAGGIYVEKDERDIPDTFMMTADYPSEHTIVLVSIMTNDVGIDDVLRGRHGTMTFEGGAPVLREQGTWWREFREANGLPLPSEGAEPDPKVGAAVARLDVPARRDHMGNFLDAIRDGARLACDVELGCATMVAIKMAVESYRQDKVMLWDAAAEVARPA